MDTAFVYDSYVTGKNFVGRKTDCNTLANLIEAGEHVAIFEPPKSGKMSVIQQALYNMRAAGKQFVVVRVNLFNVRNINDFLVKFGTSVVSSVYSTPGDYQSVMAEYLPDTHFVFDQARFSQTDEIVSISWEIDRNDIQSLMQLPGKLALEKEVRMVVIVEEFQNLMLDRKYEDVFFALEKVLGGSDRTEPHAATFILTGSQVNAMKYIFKEKKYFYRMVEHLPLQIVDDRDIIEHIVRGFLATGKVIERELVLGACRLFRGQMWYLNHFTSICDTMTRGYINENILMEALKVLISIHQPRFVSIVNDLTDHQLSLVKAVLDGVVKFSSSDVIEKYGLNSSANVRRVKDALKKKEVLTFNEKDEPVILDPLFEYWLERYFFEMR
ncbi:MAG: hypothetical protein IJN02_01465 [Bacteroidales bacterium]|nr:hypothetical protein [Bacteroidales bacterium]